MLSACLRNGTASLAVSCNVVAAPTQPLSTPTGTCESTCSTPENKVAVYTFNPINEQKDFVTAIAMNAVGLVTSW
jgi:nicotinamide mononucleotide (NMN) deamidase PncC